MNGTCPDCQRNVNVRVRRGDKISNHACPDCETPLQGTTTGKSRGRYLCPITGSAYTLGQTAVELDGPYRLVFQPGPDLAYSLPGEGDGRGGRRYAWRAEPTGIEQEYLDRAGGLILGTGCVVSALFDPHQHEGKDTAWQEQQRDRAGVRLVPVVDPGDPAGWVVNEKLTYRKCAACGSRLPDLPENRIQHEWTPAHLHVWRGRGRRGRYQEEVNQGPHPAGSLACSRCLPNNFRRA